MMHPSLLKRRNKVAVLIRFGSGPVLLCSDSFMWGLFLCHARFCLCLLFYFLLRVKRRRRINHNKCLLKFYCTLAFYFCPPPPIFKSGHSLIILLLARKTLFMVSNLAFKYMKIYKLPISYTRVRCDFHIRL